MLRSVKYGLYGVVVAGMVGGIAAWHGVDKSVTIVVDGHARQVQTTGDDVAAVLTGAGYHPNGHDLLAPPATASVSGGATIVFRRARLLRMDIDGTSRDVWTTAPTVSEALTQLGFTSANFTSVSRSRRLPLSPTEISIRTPKAVTFVHDGKTASLTTTDATVGALMSDLNITMGPDDRLSATRSALLTNGMDLTLTRVRKTTATRTRTVPFATEHKNDAQLTTGTSKIATPGRAGKLRVTYALLYINGKLMTRTKLNSETLLAVRNEVELVGTKPATVSTGSGTITVTPGSAQDIARQLLLTHGWGDDQFSCLVQMWDHESGWRTNAANPSGAYGIPQALPGSKMASAGPDWQTSARTQILWGISYISSRYGTPCGAWAQWQANGGWY